MSIFEESERTSSGISLKLYKVTMTHAMNMNVTSVNTALTCPPSMTPIHNSSAEKSYYSIVSIGLSLTLHHNMGEGLLSVSASRENYAGFYTVE